MGSLGQLLGRNHARKSEQRGVGFIGQRFKQDPGAAVVLKGEVDSLRGQRLTRKGEALSYKRRDPVSDRGVAGCGERGAVEKIVVQALDDSVSRNVDSFVLKTLLFLKNIRDGSVGREFPLRVQTEIPKHGGVFRKRFQFVRDDPPVACQKSGARPLEKLADRLANRRFGGTGNNQGNG